MTLNFSSVSHEPGSWGPTFSIMMKNIYFKAECYVLISICPRDDNECKEHLCKTKMDLYYIKKNKFKETCIFSSEKVKFGYYFIYSIQKNIAMNTFINLS